MNADDIARAIVAAAKETGADPIDVALGNDRSPGFPPATMLSVSRARAYAGRALYRVFNTPNVTVSRSIIARSIGGQAPKLDEFLQ